MPRSNPPPEAGDTLGFVPEPVEIVDVAPRDGLQNIADPVDTAVKIELIERLAAAGIRRMEATSFVNPKRVPNMADAEAVMAAFPHDRARAIGLVLNERGVERAVAAGVDEINCGVAATDTFGLRNQGATAEATVAEWGRVAAASQAAGVPCSVVVSTAFGCPFEGEVPIERVVEIAAAAAEARPARLGLADTIGAASPADVFERVAAVRPVLPAETVLSVHFHNTRGSGLANAYAAYQAGVRTFDASLGGVGGCPFAPKATGNICTEDLVYLFHRMGVDTGTDLDALADAALWLAGVLGPAVVGLYAKAGPFPLRPAS